MKAMKILASAMLLAASSLAFAQDGITRTESLRHDYGNTGTEAIQVRVDIAPGVQFPRHSHPGVEIAYVLEGTMEYQFDGQAPVTLKKGDSLYIPAGTIHSAKNVSSAPAAELATYLVEKGKPALVLAH